LVDSVEIIIGKRVDILDILDMLDAKRHLLDLMKGVFPIRSIYVLFIVTGQEEYIKVRKQELEEILKEIRELRAILIGKQSA